MSKYDRMIELNHERSVEKVSAAKTAIRRLMEEGERISVPKLMEMTGLSRGFFYKNPLIREEMNRALERQVGSIDPRRSILDKAMDSRIELLQRQVRELKNENENLKRENEKLQKALNKKNLSLLKSL